jgi:Flp pilus assembly protein CpaB
MRNKPFVIVITIAVVLGLVACVLIFMQFKTVKSKAAAQAKSADLETVDVLFAKSALDSATEITPTMVVTKKFPKKYAPPAYLSKFDDIKGRVPEYDVPEGDFILEPKLKDASDLKKASQMISPGMRLISIPINQTRSTSFLVKNGDFVDVVGNLETDIYNATTQQNVNTKITKTVLQKVRVFDIQYGAVIPEDEEGAPAASKKKSKKSSSSQDMNRMGRGTTATLEVSPEDAEKLHALVSMASDFSLVLRRFDDNIAYTSRGITPEGLLRGMVTETTSSEPAPVLAPASEPAQPKKRKFY